nr:RNA-directed DNA polymerase, eukaryota, reverse transcriptase zinc-binding domain protein [Tanacetum cinerariifolium]
MANRQPPVFNSRFRQLYDISSTIFISNFPRSSTSKDFWQLCDRHGVVTDVYIAHKLSKIGQRFGFVRFIKIKDLKTLIEDLNKIWIGNYHLFASKARFDQTQSNVKEFAGWSPDIDVATVISDEVNELESTDNESDVNHNKDVQEEEEVELKENDHLDDQIAIDENLQTEALQHEENMQQSQTKTPSHPPGFEGFKVHSSRNSINKGNKRSNGHSFALSFIDEKVTNEGVNKCKAISRLCAKHNVAFLAKGRSGGIQSVWDPQSFIHVRSVHMDAMLIVEGEWILNHFKCYMVNIYAPQDDRKKEELWQTILTFRNENPGSYILFGDFNVVRNPSERVGSQFNLISASSFNNFINDGFFWDMPLGGHAYTRLSSSGYKLSKLDRFFIFEHALPFFQNHHAMVLDSFVSDHRHIILKHALVDFRPVPFKFYNSWLSEPSLDAMIKSVSYEPELSVCASYFISFKDKLKKLKLAIKSFAKSLLETKCKDKDALMSNIKELETLLENGNGGTPIYQQRYVSIQQLRHMEHKDNLDAMQKAKIKWSIESDENSKIFHGLHVAVEDAILVGCFQGVTVGSLSISHLLFVDDVVFLGEWSRSHIINVVNLIQCFYRVSGLKVNLHKYNLYGMCVSYDEVERLALLTGCNSHRLPFVYLGLLIAENLYGMGVSYDEVERLALLTGCNSHRLPFVYLGLLIAENIAKQKGWEPIGSKFNIRMSRWKASRLSIGGRTTLLSSVLGALDTYYFSLFPLPKCIIKTLESIRAQFFWGNDDNSYKIPWIAWNSTLASKANGGLGIGSLKSPNHALIQKWRWRFLKIPTAVWVMAIKAIHGLSEDSFIFNCSVKGNGVWARIVKDINAMNDQGLIPHQVMKRNVRDGRTTRFWKDHWMGDTPLQHQFPRLFRLEVNQDCMVRDRWNNGCNWIWSRPISGGNNSTQLSIFNTLLDPIFLSEARDEWV